MARTRRRNSWIAGALAAVFGGGAAVAAPVASAAGGAIYVCVDAQGRHISADRQVADCRDQTQRVLDASGVTRAVVQPEVSPAEQQGEADRRRSRARAEFHRKSRERADTELLIRYPTVAAHDAARRTALEQPQLIIRLAQERIADLEEERAALRAMASNAITPERAAVLRTNEEAIAAQRRLIAAQGEERAEINRRFDDEAARLLAIRRAHKPD